MIAQVYYNRFDENILSKIRVLKRMGIEVILVKGERNLIFINSYLVWRDDESEDIRDAIYDVKIYDLIRESYIGISS
ncbi:hypothetical protein SUSAZ_04545 [Sulfolobus acidocaldarius SUSAZ]|nr:hypothetical protein SUSAZ_04545 [Sulfolobus acidocaldarius SUSAZ]